jgi:hypothetical protein
MGIGIMRVLNCATRPRGVDLKLSLYRVELLLSDLRISFTAAPPSATFSETRPARSPSIRLTRAPETGYVESNFVESPVHERKVR